MSFSVAVVALTVLSLILGKPTNTGNLRPLISFMVLFAPTILVWIAEEESLKGICRQYLTFSAINWKNAVTVIICSAVWFTIIPMAMVYVVGNVFGFSGFGGLTEGSVDLFGIINYNASTMSGTMTAVVLNSILSLTGGIIAAVVMVVFSEIAWRGFLPKYLRYGQYMLPVAVGTLWTLWDLPNLIFSQSVVYVIPVLFKNIALSYFLIEVVKKTGSIWISSVVIGIVSAGMIVPLYCSSSIYTSSIITVVSALTLWLIIRRWLKTSRNQ